MTGLVQITGALKLRAKAQMNLKVKLGKLDIQTHMEYCYSDRVCYTIFLFCCSQEHRLGFSAENIVK